MEKKGSAGFGAWAFLIGVILALIAGLIPGGDLTGIITAVLVIIGIIVGFLNVSDEETEKFLVTSVAIMIAVYTAREGMASLTTLGTIGDYMKSLLTNINIFVFPATIVVGIKAIYGLAHN
ncbi:MAG: hypothetical protein V1663_01955 [archaeon]